jgi:hypothetical protein
MRPNWALAGETRHASHGEPLADKVWISDHAHGFPPQKQSAAPVRERRF